MSSSSNSNEGPKLYTTKPKKPTQLKNNKVAKDFSTPTTTAPPPPPPQSSSMNPPPPSTASSSSTSSVPPPPSFARRYKFVWPILLTVNLAIGGYLFLRTNKKDKSIEDGEVAADVPPTAAASTTATVPEISITPPLIEPVKVREPIPEDQQREIYKWILEEKRKVKPKDREEKKRIDEEKALLKQVIRGKSIPSL